MAFSGGRQVSGWHTSGVTCHTFPLTDLGMVIAVLRRRRQTTNLLDLDGETLQAV